MPYNFLLEIKGDAIQIHSYESSSHPGRYCELLTFPDGPEGAAMAMIVLPTGTMELLQDALIPNYRVGSNLERNHQFFCKLVKEAATFRDTASEAMAAVAFRQRLEYFAKMNNVSLQVYRAGQLVADRMLDLILDAAQGEVEGNEALIQRLDESIKFAYRELWFDPEWADAPPAAKMDLSGMDVDPDCNEDLNDDLLDDDDLDFIDGSET